MDPLHSLLKRQLKKHFGELKDLPSPWRSFIDLINDAYHEFDEDRALLERSLELSSQELLQANSELRAVLKAFPDLFIWMDMEGTIFDCKEGTTSDLVLPREEVIGKKIQNIPEPAIGELFLEALREIRTRQAMVNLEYALVLEERKLFFEARLLPLMKDQILGVVRNITERKMAEAELHRSREEFKELYEVSKRAEAVYRSLIHSSADAIVIYDLQGRVTYLSPSFTRIFGWTLEELKGRKIPFVPPSGEISTNAVIHSVLKKGIPCQGFETQRYTKDHCLLDISISASRFLDHEGRPAGTLVLLRDITESKKMEQRLRVAEKMEAIGNLAGGVAHDLNNILGGLVSYPDLLLLEMDPEDPRRDFILSMQASGLKAAAIVQDLLALARRGVPKQVVLNLNQVIQDYLKSPEFEGLLTQHKKVKVETRCSPDLHNLVGSPVHLSKMVMNLVHNAAEAMPEGGTITLITENRVVDRPLKGYERVEEGEYVTLSVSDPGIGISAGDIPRVFEPFYTKKVMGRSGSGLGMAVVWGTVKDHKGYIDLQSELDRGTTITVYFPSTRKSLNDVKFFIPMSEYLGKGEIILVVDDMQEQREIAFRMLEELGYVPMAVGSGEEAIEHLKSGPMDLILLDMIMEPGMDGLDTWKEVLRFHPNQKAILVSGFSETDRVKEAQELGAGPYLQKPYTIQELGLAVQSELARSRL